MPRLSRFKIRGAKYILIRENGNSFNVAFSRYPIWGTAIKQFRDINHINIGENVLESSRTLISKAKEEELNYTMRLPLKNESELTIEMQIVEEANMKMLNIEIENEE
ncbi:MAG: hypothetical protein ACP6IP_02095 [Candidatus Njordarchaeia archaeon]